MRRFLLIGRLSTAAALAQEQAPASSRGHFHFGPGVQLAYAGSRSAGLILALHAIADLGDWMVGADARAGILRSPSFVLGVSARSTDSWNRTATPSTQGERWALWMSSTARATAGMAPSSAPRPAFSGDGSADGDASPSRRKSPSRSSASAPTSQEMTCTASQRWACASFSSQRQPALLSSLPEGEIGYLPPR